MSANRMFVLLATVVPQTSTCLQATSDDTIDLWHRRYGHLNHKSLRFLQYKKMVTGLPELKTTSKLCTSCMVGKQHRDVIPKKSTKKQHLKYYITMLIPYRTTCAQLAYGFKFG
ncbi:hypothetical protein ACLB2K_075730 [Fragaria x ananassa]